LLEPMQGEGGVIPADQSFLQGIRKLCDQHGILLIMDEVQTGLGRTGRWFGFQHTGITPDIVTTAKALGNGVPIGAVWATEEVADAFKPGDHGSTFGGQPLAAAAAREVLRIMTEINAPEMARLKGQALTKELLDLPGVESVRGWGLLLGVEINHDGLAGRTGPEIAAACLKAGLIVNGITPTALRLAPPITITDQEITQGVALLADVLNNPEIAA